MAVADPASRGLRKKINRRNEERSSPSKAANLAGAELLMLCPCSSPCGHIKTESSVQDHFLSCALDFKLPTGLGVTGRSCGKYARLGSVVGPCKARATKCNANSSSSSSSNNNPKVGKQLTERCDAYAMVD
ncbi:unnamed protein product [Ceratitis capitata]|uniref:(Mediterranean fruit fly) hypothetical protein n=1 Tax=Ceratitis capitata TaxID=7213 RepID=A0A811UDS3_CERCA|nr:unnamed protein product [Ceratitis capitata]